MQKFNIKKFLTKKSLIKKKKKGILIKVDKQTIILQINELNERKMIVKKTYERPIMIVEPFTANNFVAKCNTIITKDTLAPANCVNPAHYDGPVPNQKEEVFKNHHGSPITGGFPEGSNGRVNNVFTEKSTNCVTIIPTTGITANPRYYPEEGDMVYLFNTNQLIKYRTGENISQYCFGSFQHTTGSSTTVIPLS